MSTIDPTILPASYVSSTFVSGPLGTAVTFHFDNSDEADSWHEAVTREHDAEAAAGTFDEDDAS